MRITRSISVIVSLLLLSGPVSYCQSYFSQHLGIQNGLSSADIWSVFQDSKGYLWLGSSAGISRYNGYSFVNFSEAGNKKIGPIYSIVESGSGKLWVGGPKGIFIYENGGFFAIDPFPFGCNVLFFDKGNQLWVGSENGLFYFPFPDRDQDTWRNAGAGDESFLSDPRITAIDEEEEGAIFFSTHYAVYQKDSSGFHKIWGDPGQKPDICSIEALKADSIFWACDESSCFFWNGETAVPWKKNISRPIQIEKDGKGMFVLSSAAIYRVDSLNTLPLLQDQDHGVEWMRSFTMDREGILWIGTFEGILKVRPTAFRQFTPHQFPDLHEIYSAAELPDGTILFGGNQGKVVRMDEEGASVYAKVFPNAEVFSIFKEDNHNYWLGSGYQGIAHWKDDRIVRYTVADGLGDNSRYFFFLSSRGELWTGGDGGVDRILRSEERGELQFISINYPTGGSHYVSFYNMVEGPDGRLWLGSNEGLFCIEEGRIIPGNIEDYSAVSPHITDIIQDRKGRIWISTLGQGLLLCGFDNNSGNLRFQQAWSEKGGNFLSLLEDEKGCIWAGTYRGLLSLRTEGAKSFSVRAYDESDGFPVEAYSRLSLFEDSRGEVWVLTMAGISSFYPDQLIRNPSPPGLQLEEVQLFEGKDDIYQYGKEGRVDGLPAGLCLPYNKNYLRFHFSPLSLADPGKNRVRYRLKGLSDEWKETPFTGSIWYPRLSPGSYSFELFVSNNDGVWTDKAIHYPFEIKRPFWKTGWFRLSLIALGLTIGWLIIYFQNQRRMEKERARRGLLEKDRQLLQLNRKMAEVRLAALQSQMNPHFLFNSLNALHFYILQNHKDLASRFLNKFSRLVRLILEHSRLNQVSLSRELEALELYLTLEQLRLDHGFVYTIDLDPSIDTELTKVPPMLLQPVVENAIWHGIMPKEGRGWIKIKIVHTEKALEVRVRDNGVGRKEVKNRKSLTDEKKKSYGLTIIKERLQLAFPSPPAEPLLLITDLKTPEGEPCGTGVRILLPIK